MESTLIQKIRMSEEEKYSLQERIVEVLKTIYDPEIPIDIYNLGLIYRIEVQDDAHVEIDMTLTAPGCPAADFIMEDVKQRIEGIPEVRQASVNLVFEPEWNQSLMSEEARLELGYDVD